MPAMPVSRSVGPQRHLGLGVPVPDDTRPRTDAPRTNKDLEELDRKMALLSAPHIAPLTGYVERLRAARGADRVPHFDPTEAGIHAPILFLLEAPGAKATRERGGSGFVSPDNNDGTAQNMWELLRDASYDRGTDVVTWNVVPWYIGSDTKIRPAESQDLLDSRPYVRVLLMPLACTRHRPMRCEVPPGRRGRSSSLGLPRHAALHRRTAGDSAPNAPRLRAATS